MTWREFKDIVDVKLGELGKREDVQIDLIHVVQPRLQGQASLRIGMDPRAGLVVEN